MAATFYLLHPIAHLDELKPIKTKTGVGGWGAGESICTEKMFPDPFFYKEFNRQQIFFYLDPYDFISCDH